MSKAVRRILSWLGLLGFVLCVLCVVVVWFVVMRIDRATEQLYQRVDHSFDVAGERLGDVQERVAGAALSAEELRESLRNAGTERVRENLDSLLRPEERIERLNGNLEQADTLLEPLRRLCCMFKRCSG